jgi:hypothetical protein
MKNKVKTLKTKAQIYGMGKKAQFEQAKAQRDALGRARLAEAKVMHKIAKAEQEKADAIKAAEREAAEQEAKAKRIAEQDEKFIDSLITKNPEDLTPLQRIILDDWAEAEAERRASAAIAHSIVGDIEGAREKAVEQVRAIDWSGMFDKSFGSFREKLNIVDDENEDDTLDPEEAELPDEAKRFITQVRKMTDRIKPKTEDPTDDSDITTIIHNIRNPELTPEAEAVIARLTTMVDLDIEKEE